MLDLPEGVHAVRSKGRMYYYWHPNRGTRLAGKATPLGTNAKDPEFWTRLRTAQGHVGGILPGSFAALIAEYKRSSRFTRRRERTQRHYLHQLARIEAAWGALPVANISPDGIYALRARYEDTPVAANHLVSMLRTLLKFGVQRSYLKANPAREVEDLDIEDEENAKPWPEWAYQLVLKSAPTRLYRALYLGRACGQRRSDLVKLGKKNRRDDGLAFKVGKLRDRDHFIPLTREQLREIDSWDCTDLGPWIVSAGGDHMSGDNLQTTLRRLVKSIPELNGLTLRMHGLRAMACCDRKLAGAENKAIGANLRMSTQMVERYIRHIDEAALARGVRDRLENGFTRS